MAETASRIIVTGRVQGVGFRLWTCREARRRSLRGWVRNRYDGSVEALLIGSGEGVEALIAACHQGPSMAQVEHVRRFPAADDGSADFSERPTV
jgi:acylphosphatase